MSSFAINQGLSGGNLQAARLRVEGFLQLEDEGLDDLKCTLQHTWGLGNEKFG